MALSDIINQMDLKKVEVVAGRGEELAKSREYQARFDYVVTRAAGKLDDVVKWSRGFLKKFELPGKDVIPTGTLIVLKGARLTMSLEQHDI